MTRSASFETTFEIAVRDAVQDLYGIEIPSVPLTFPPTADLGDLATPVAFELARKLRKPPRAIAEALANRVATAPGLHRVEVAGAGYLNAFLDRTQALRRWILEGFTAPPPEGPKVIVEHTNINPNKAAHIGHLRNAVLGDTLVRCLRELGRRVEVQNYIDDTGVQVADLVVGFRVLRGMSLDQIRERYDEARLRERGERFDYVAWDLYADVTRFYEEDDSRLRHRRETLEAMERGGNPVAEMAAYLAHRIVHYHLRTMHRIGVDYHLLPKESDILALRFWDDAFRQLRQKEAIRVAREGKNAGCWVMDLPGTEPGKGEDQKIIVRSDGTVTYVGKDIAYQMWKLGLLQRDFRYRRFDWQPDDPLYDLWETTAGEGDPNPPSFGRGALVYNVIDVRQSYLQRVVVQALRALGHTAAAEASIHFAYEMVALTPASVQALFPELEVSEADRRRPYLEMSGRRGLGVRADDLVNALLDRAGREVRERNPDLDEATLERIAREIAVGALRYYMLRFSRNRVVAFDLDDALAFEGETGPYLQYSVVRAKNILAKLRERRGADETDPEALASGVDVGALAPETVADHWELARMLSRMPAVVGQAVASLELSTVAKHAYALAQRFNSFYHRYPVAQEDDDAVRRTRAALVLHYQAGMTRLLDLMGVPTPERM